jgi:uncharacterized damage-inducible protein DinB
MPATFMTTDDIQILYEFDRWANNRVLQSVSTLSPEQFTRDLGGSFRSVRDTLVHIIGCEWAWLVCWKEPTPTSAFVSDVWERNRALFKSDAYPDLGAVKSKWTEVQNDMLVFVNRATNESLQRLIPVFTKKITLGHLMQHLANHSTYHRGQISLMMRQLSAEPCATDFAMFMMEGRPEKAGAH